jgi:hypothetical protein
MFKYRQYNWSVYFKYDLSLTPRVEGVSTIRCVANILHVKHNSLNYTVNKINKMAWVHTYSQ